MSEKEQSKYPNPDVECPKCSAVIQGTTRLRVKYTGPTPVPDWKLLERFYRCPCSAGGFWREVQGKEVEDNG